MTMVTTRVAITGWPTAVVLRRVVWRHPEWWTALIAAAVWVAIVLHAAGYLADSAAAEQDLVWGVGRGGHTEALALLGGSTAMVTAMMVPLILPTVRHVALSSLWRRRHRAAAVFLTSYLAVWVSVSLIMVVTQNVAASLVGELVTVVIAFAAAAAWQLTPTRRRALRRCRRTAPLAPRGWRADRDCARFGVVMGWNCVVTCWALMALAMTAAHSLPVLLVVFGVQLNERLRRRLTTDFGAAIVAVLGVALLAAQVLSH